MLLRKMGIFGWEDTEVPVLCSIVAGKPLLMIGAHGTNKTDGAKRLAQVFLGQDTNFQKYDTHLINSDDLVGILDAWNKDPTQALDYRPTIYSLWNKDAVLFDEFALGSPRVQARVLEVIRTREVMGRKTGLKLVMCSANPPGQYDTTYVGLQTASRLVWVNVPSLDTLQQDDVTRILNSTNLDPFTDEVQLKNIEEARVVLRGARDRFVSGPRSVNAALGHILVSLGTELTKHVTYSARQLKDLRDLWFAYKALRDSGYRPKVSELDDLVLLVQSTIPELSGMVKVSQSFRASETQDAVYTVLTSVNLDTKWLFVGTLAEILQVRSEDIKNDPKAWAHFVLKALEDVDSKPWARSVVKRIKEAQYDLASCPDEIRAILAKITTDTRKALTRLDPGSVFRPSTFDNEVRRVVGAEAQRVVAKKPVAATVWRTK